MKTLNKVVCLCFLSHQVAYVSENTKKISIHDAMLLSEQNSSEVKKQLNSLSYSEKGTLVSYFSYGPSLSLSDTYNVYPHNFKDNINHDYPDNRSNLLSATITQPISGLWQNTYKVENRTSIEEAVKFDLQAAKIQARLKAAVSFMNVSVAKQTLDIYKANLVIAEKQFEDTKILFRSGEANKTKVDVLKMEYSFVKAKTDVLKANLEFENSLLELKNILGLDEKLNLDILPEHLSYAEKVKGNILDLNTFILNFENNKPEIKSIEQQIRNVTTQNSQNKFNYLPQINAVANYSISNGLNSSQMIGGSFLENSSTKKFFYYGLSFVWNIWDGGITLQNNFDLLRNKNEYIIQKEELQKNYKNEIEKEYKNFQTLLIIQESNKNALNVNEEAFNLSLIQYKLGSISASDLVQIQNDLTNARIELLKNTSNVDLSWLKLQGSAGMTPNFNMN